jgi:phospholipase/lecithinase/hemolysin
MNQFVRTQSFLAASLVAVMALIASTAVAESDFDQIIFFGDSLSDSGNAFVLLGTVSVRPFEPIPSAPYARGGKHFSNGPTWAEQFARDMGMNRSGKPAFRVPGEFTNYAVGGSRARLEGTINLTTQVGLFAQDFPVAPADALYSIVIGGNDVRDAVAALAGDPSGATSAQIIEDAVAGIAANMQTLVGMGATQFIVGNVPNVGLAPAVRYLDPPIPTLATQFSAALNQGLELVLTSIEADPDVSIARLDAFSFVTDAVADPTAFGLKYADFPCLTFFVRAGAFCSQPDDYLFWDGIHPTRAGHGALAAIAIDAFD